MYDSGQPTVDENGELVVGLLPSQIEVLTWEHEWGAVRGGKGAGKTIGLCLWMLQRLELYPKAAHFVVGADFEQLRRGFFQSFIDTLTSIGWEEGVDFRYRESPSPMIVILATGARLRSLGAIQANRIESVEFQTLLLEEPQTWKNGEVIYGILNTRMRHSKRSASDYGRGEPNRPALKMQARMSFNPPVIGSWLHEIVEKRWQPRGFPCLRVSVRDNYLMLDVDAYIKRLESALPPSQWPSQIDGHWSTPSGGALLEFDRNVHGLQAGAAPDSIPRGVDPNLPLLIGCDFNVGHQRWVIAQVHTQREYQDGFVYARDRMPVKRTRLDTPGWKRRVLRFIDEIAIDNTGSRQMAQAFIERYGVHAKRTGVVLYGDSTGNNRSQLDGVSSNWSVIMDTLTLAAIPYRYAVKTNGPVVDRVVAFDAVWRSGEGVGAAIDIEACPELLADCEGRARWNGTRTDLDKKSDARATHAFDAASYLASGFSDAVAARVSADTLGKQTLTLSR